MKMTLAQVGNWTGNIEMNLRNALNLSIDIIGRTGEEACRHAVILMAQSARALTIRSKAKRKILQDAAAGGLSKGSKMKGARYIEVWHQGEAAPHKLYEYRWKFGFGSQPKLSGSFEQARTIKNSGLAKRSWMWGLSKLGGKEEGRQMSGVSRTYAIKTDTSCGYIKENRLSYILKNIMPSNWETFVEKMATKKIFGQAALKMERKFQSRVRFGERAIGKTLQSFFRSAS